MKVSRNGERGEAQSADVSSAGLTGKKLLTRQNYPFLYRGRDKIDVCL